MTARPKAPVRIGLLRLADSAPAVLAVQRGLFAELGLHVELSVEPSWANIADKLAYGLLDAASMLPPLALDPHFSQGHVRRGARRRFCYAMPLTC
jgi:ABC-type nitrate/sulfonate/bicarbonate transport system substrate-binding protein